jgi:hypothetical protein
MAQKNPRFTSPRGVAVYPHLTSPDTKFKDEGEFHTKLRVPADAAAATVKQIDAEIAKIAAETKKEKKLKTVKMSPAPYSVDDETGDVTFTFKMKASGISKKTNKPWERTPTFFDAKGNVLVEAPKIGGGSTLRVNYRVLPVLHRCGGCRREARARSGAGHRTRGVRWVAQGERLWLRAGGRLRRRGDPGCCGWLHGRGRRGCAGSWHEDDDF